MIDAKEIKLGNWFHHNNNWCYRQQMTDHKEFDFQWDEADWMAFGESTLYLENVEPIPLTIDWLLKFGFKKIEQNGYTYYQVWWDKDIFWGFMNPNGFFCIMQYERRSINVAYVHQLQNQFFGLTGEDFTYYSPAQN